MSGMLSYSTTGLSVVALWGFFFFFFNSVYLLIHPNRSASPLGRSCKLRVLDLQNILARTSGACGLEPAVMGPQAQEWHQWLSPGQWQSSTWLHWRFLWTCAWRKRPWTTSSPTSFGGWSRESLPSTCVVKKLMIVSTPMENIVKVLSMVQLDCIQEVQVNCTWNLPTLATFICSFPGWDQ